ncbi:MAG: hypothetical protein EOM92_03060 [Gammaproteobacteria bacterium]|jgi:hypothetical protein|nr:hypothetical protein [Gammaproteobacteria bacterium]
MKNWFVPCLALTLALLSGCVSHPGRQVAQSATPTSPTPVKYCPVNLYDVRDVRPCFASQAECQQSIAKSAKYVCNPASALKYQPKQP